MSDDHYLEADGEHTAGGRRMASGDENVCGDTYIGGFSAVFACALPAGTTASTSRWAAQGGVSPFTPGVRRMAERFQRCVHCRERIEQINFALGPKWMHWPTPSGNYTTREKYEYCRGARAEPEPAHPGGEG